MAGRRAGRGGGSRKSRSRKASRSRSRSRKVGRPRGRSFSRSRSSSASKARNVLKRSSSSRSRKTRSSKSKIEHQMDASGIGKKRLVVSIPRLSTPILKTSTPIPKTSTPLRSTQTETSYIRQHESPYTSLHKRLLNSNRKHQFTSSPSSSIWNGSTRTSPRLALDRFSHSDMEGEEVKYSVKEPIGSKIIPLGYERKLSPSPYRSTKQRWLSWPRRYTVRKRQAYFILGLIAAMILLYLVYHFYGHRLRSYTARKAAKSA